MREALKKILLLKDRIQESKVERDYVLSTHLIQRKQEQTKREQMGWVYLELLKSNCIFYLYVLYVYIWYIYIYKNRKIDRDRYRYVYMCVNVCVRVWL